MREQLIAMTIGGQDKTLDPAYKAAVFKEYIEKAFPNLAIRDVEPISTAASLNSISAYADIAVQGSGYKPAFLKIHVESDTDNVSPLGAENEYSQATLLAQHGWPVLTPLMSSDSHEYPLLIYPRVDAPTLFDLLKESYDKDENLITSRELAVLSRLNRQVGRAMVDSSKLVNSKETVSSPLQTLLLERFKEGGRIDEWYESNTRFLLGGNLITFQELLKTRWVINGEPYNITLGDIIENARRYLSFDGESRALVCVSHGDDHAGNIFMDGKVGRATIFDPAFAGWNPASLSNVKALAHSCVLPMGGMYYDPKIGDVSYNWDENKNAMFVDVPFENSVLYGVHEALAKQIVDLRILPLIKRAKRSGISVGDEFERIKYALSGCSLLTINVANLLEQDDGRGEALLPLTIMFAELKGLPSLSYLKEKITQEL